MRAILYARLSRDDREEDQLRSGSVERQLAETRERAIAAGDVVASEFFDDGISGTALHRPGIDAVLRAAGPGARVWVKNQSRLARDVDLVGYYRIRLREAGAELVCWAEEGQHRMVRHVQGVVDEAHVIRCREEAERILPARARSGLYNGGPVPFGMELHEGKLRPNSATAHVVARAFELADEGEPLSKIAAEIGVRLPRLRYWLRSPVYAGAAVWMRHKHVMGKTTTYAKARPRGEWIVTWGALEAIVPRERWERVQARLDAASSEGKRARCGRRLLALSGILRCSECRQPMKAIGGYKTPRGYTHVYGCRTEGCRAIPAISTGGWTASVLEHVLRLLADEAQVALMAQEIAAAYQAGRETGHLEAEARRLEKREATLVEAIASADEGSPPLVRELNETSRALAESRQRLQEARSSDIPMLDPRALKRSILAAADRLRELPDSVALDEIARPLLSRIVEAVWIHPDRKTGSIDLSPSGLAGIQLEDHTTRRS